jgi:hypothetical protein
VNASSCEACPSGSFQSKHMQTMCDDCGFGSVNLFGPSASNATCLMCPSGKYSDSKASTECLDCELGSWSSILGATSKASCSKCPLIQGVSCPKGSPVPLVSGGLFRTLESPDNITICFPAEACLYSGYGNTSCSIGYEGIGCSLCIAEYFRSFGKCVKCLHKGLRWGIIVATSVGLILFMLKLTQKNQSVPIPLKMLLFWIQFLSLYPALSTSWPPLLSSLLNLSGLLILDIGFLGVGCDVSNSFYSVLTAKILFPLLFFAIIFVIGVFKDHHHFQSVKDSFLKAFAYMVFAANFFSIQILSSMMQVFNCVSTGMDGIKVFQDPSITCFDAVWTKFVVFDSCMIFFYLIALPLALVRMFSTSKKGDSNVMNFILKTLTDGYKEGSEWFEFVRLLLKFGFVLVRDVFRFSSNGKIAFLSLLFLVHVWSESNWRPYENAAHQNLSLL